MGERHVDGTAQLNALVHKTDSSEALLTDWSRIGEGDFLIQAVWPADHPFYRSLDGRYDPMIVVETVRQAVPLLSHAAYGMPMEHRQSWSELSLSIDPTAVRATGAPTPVELRVTCSNVTHRAGRLASLTMAVDVRADGAPLATVRTSFANYSPPIYQRLRGAYADLARARSRALPLLPPVPASHVRRSCHTDVVLAPTDKPDQFQLRTDLDHPVLFDHPVDHAPGMLLLEAARQAAHLATHPRQGVVVGLESFFVRYAELDDVCSIDVDVLPREQAAPHVRKVLVSFTQAGSCVCSAVVTVADSADAAP